MSERARPLVVADEEALAKIICSVTDKWDEPLDEVHDVPQIVNALIAAGVVQTRAQVVASLAEDEAFVSACCRWFNVTNPRVAGFAGYIAAALAAPADTGGTG